MDGINQITKIICHADCPDGIASAMILHDVFPDVEIKFLKHSQEEYKNLKPEPNILFCDITPPEHNWKKFLDLGCIVLDHHASVEHISRQFMAVKQGFYGRIEDGWCGANIAFNKAWKPLKKKSPDMEKIIEFIRIVAIGDCYLQDQPEWHLACAYKCALRFYPISYWLNNHEPYIKDNEIFVGKLLFEKILNDTIEATKNLYNINKHDLKFSIYPSTRLIMEMPSLLIDTEKADVLIGFDSIIKNNTLHYLMSIRSNDKFNSGEFAKDNGGGGHFKAAAFSIESPNINSLHFIDQLIDRFFKRDG